MYNDKESELKRKMVMMKPELRKPDESMENEFILSMKSGKPTEKNLFPMPREEEG